jgi:DeoR/GlpR family transcriptional regulator of sugar metabolism
MKPEKLLVASEVAPRVRVRALDHETLRRVILNELLCANVPGNPTLTELQGAYEDAIAKLAAKPRIGIATLQAKLGELKRKPHPGSGYDLHVPKPISEAKGIKPSEGSGIVKIGLRTKFDESAGKLPKTKLRLAATLWWHILGDGFQGSISIDKKARDISDAVKRTIASLRSKPTLSIFLDSGTTTLAAASILLASGRMPLRVLERETDQIPSHLITPELITNSPKIVSYVAALPAEVRQVLRVRLVGGDINMDIDSICGSMAEASLEKWDLLSDIAVLGATEAGDIDGVFSFGCYDRDEARFKASILRRVNGLRVVMLDASKLGKKPTRVFAGMAKSDIDLVVVDKGRRDTTEFERLANAAKRNGVSVIWTETDPDDEW